MKFHFAGVLGLALLFPALLGAQQPASGDQTTALSSTTELVLVPAQVKGHDGKPLLGLKQQDFVLRSDGKSQPIRVFDETMGSEEKSQPANGVSTSPSGDRVFNVPPSGMPDQILIIAIDLVNTPFIDQGRAKQQLLKYLSGQLPNRPFALVVITKNGAVQIHGVSSDPAVLAEALKLMQGSTTKDVADEPVAGSLASWEINGHLTPKDAYSSLMRAFSETQIYGAFAQKIAVRATLTALLQIAQAYAGVPGRKSIVWLTGGMPTVLADPFAGGITNSSVLNGDPELLAEYQQTFAVLNNANIAIYGVDLKGPKLDQSNDASGLSAAQSCKRD